MLHRIGSIGFISAIVFYLLRYIKGFDKKLSVKLHIYTGMVGALAMTIYSIVDFIKEKELSIISIGLSSLFIIISGNEKVRKKYKKLHIISFFIFTVSLFYHIIK